MKSAIIIAIAVGISVVSVFVISEIIWYFANQEFEKAREELKESLADIFEKQYEPISEQKESTNISSQECSGTAQCIRGTISQIIDGDTIKVNGESIRFALSSAPELKAYGGTESRNFIETICPVGSDVLIDEDDGQILGSYGRMVGVVYCNEVNLNSELLDADLGYLEVRFCDSSEFADESWAKKHGCTTDSKVGESP